jgi:hypothetical protein
MGAHLKPQSRQCHFQTDMEDILVESFRLRQCVLVTYLTKVIAKKALEMLIFWRLKPALMKRLMQG